MENINSTRQLNFSGAHITGTFVTTVREFYINKPTVVLNPNQFPAIISETPYSIIPPFSSTILADVTIHSAQSLVLVEVIEPLNMGNIILEDGWALYWDLIKDSYTPTPGTIPYPPNTPLWRSPQDELALFELDPFAMTYQDNPFASDFPYTVKANLWYAPAHTNCFIHNLHNFIEIHGQIVGRGRMQKFKAQDYEALYEDQRMSPGYTTPVPFCHVTDSHTFTYPWHQYYADTDCIWIAIEYHPTDN